MKQRRFLQVDVFADEPCRGNPLAVVLDAEGLDDATLQRFANWTNLSETTFLLPPTHPTADYRVRIFTTSMELPFAGHPTLGSCHAWLQAGGRPKQAVSGVIVQECGAGLIEIRRTNTNTSVDADLLAFAAPPLRKSGPLDDGLVDKLMMGLNLVRSDIVAHQWLVNGPQWAGVLLPSAAHVLNTKPNFAVLKGVDFGLVGPYPAGSPHAYEVRGFSFVDGPTEDPVTGSLNAGIAQWLMGSGRAPAQYVAAQGTVLGRSGRVHLARAADGRIWVGGRSHTLVSGHVQL